MSRRRVVPRQKISEFRAKTILSEALGLPYAGQSVDTAATGWKQRLAALPAMGRYVVKVDQGIKGRFKKGLIRLDLTSPQLPKVVKELSAQGFRHALIEPFQEHAPTAEYYLAIERRRAGNFVMFSKLGGVNVEHNAQAIRHEPLKPSSAGKIEQDLGLKPGTIETFGRVFEDNYFSFLEINPLVISGGVPTLLDAAALVDDAAASFVAVGWTPADFRDTRAKTPEELAIAELASQSQASFRLNVLNPDGAVFLLLSGGGASILLADEVYNQGYGRELGNYGEYSGNPTEEETYLYTRQVLSLMLKSKAPRKVLIIGGGVANFTDIRLTFRGIIRALAEVKAELRRQHIQIFVRRGGPHEAAGLATMAEFLRSEDFYGHVAGPELTLSDIVPTATASLSRTATR